MTARKCASSVASMAARKKNVATSETTAMTGLRRVMVNRAHATIAMASSQKTTCSPDETPLAAAASTSGHLLERRGADARADAPLELRLEVGAELGQEAEHRPRGGVAQRADGVAADAVGDV